MTEQSVKMAETPRHPAEKSPRPKAEKAAAAGLNIDYYPTNFIVQDGVIWYIDYECNEFMEQWSFENWGKQYWQTEKERS